MNSDGGFWWLTPVTTLIAALLGGMVPMLTALFVLEIQAERDRMGSLLRKSESLFSGINEYQRNYFIFMRIYELNQHVDDRLHYFLPCEASFKKLMEVVLSLISETDDSDIDKLAEFFTEQLNRINSHIRDLYKSESVLNPTEKQVEQEYNRYKAAHLEIMEMHEELSKLSALIMWKASELKRTADRPTIDRIREYVSKA